MYRLVDRLDPELLYLASRACFAEMALAGITCVGEFHYVHHGPGGRRYADANEMGRAVIAAATEAGVRLTLLDTCYLRGGFDAELSAVQRRFSDGTADAWAERVDGLRGTPLVRVGAAIHSVRAVDPASMGVVAGWANASGAPLHAHVSEQPRENADCLAATGRTPVELLAEHGALGARFGAVHATHLTDHDIALLGDAGVTAVFCPTTERDLADGVGPSLALVSAGARLAVGTDSHALIDVFEEARAVELDQRLVTGERGVHAPADLLTAATADGYAVLGWDGGRIHPGEPADLTTVSLESVRLAGTDAAHAPAAVLFGAAPADVTHVVVGGEEVVRDGRHVRIDPVRDLWAALR
jgi:formiminoglutamate deiminase